MRGFGDARGTLLHEVLRLAHSRKPAVVLLENVRNYLSHDGGQTHSSTLRLLEQCGYSVYFQVLNSSDYGVPQKRQRLFYVCFRKDLQVSSFSFPEPSKRSVCLEDILLCDDDPCLQSLYIERSDLRMKELPNAPENRPLRIGTVGKGGQGERVYSPMGHAVTLSAYGGGIGAKTGMYLVKDRIRRLHPQECRRLMGFPEEFKLHQRFNVCYKQFGNSVVIPVVEAIVKKIEQALFQTNLEMA